MSTNKAFEWAVKSGSLDGHKGQVTALVSAFGNVDAQGDVVLPGAFTNSVAAWRRKMARGEYLPVVYAHKDSPDAIIGKVTGLRETAEGLEVDEQFFMGKPMARDTFAAILEGVLPKSSFAYDVKKAKANNHGGYDLAELDVLEVGSTLYAANSATYLVGVKGAKADVDTSAWDANRAMSECSTAAEYRSICAGERTEGEPDQRAHWALPHHYLSKVPTPNAAGVRAAMAALGGARGGAPNLANAARARSHLEAHMRAITPDYEPSGSSAPAAGKADVTVDAPEVLEAFKVTLDRALGAKAGREISAKNAALIQQMHDVAHQLLGMPAHEAAAEEDNQAAPPGTKAEEPQVKADEFPVLAEMQALFT
jgi:HK97 family phage prohead protease